MILGVLAIGLITIGNLRGLREAGNLFAIPTYLFLGSALLMIAVGSIRIVFFREHARTTPRTSPARSARPPGPVGASCSCGPSPPAPWP